MAEEEPFQSIPQQYFGCRHGDNGVAVEQDGAIEDLQSLELLDEELLQSERFMAV